MKRLSTFVLPLLIAASLTACKKNQAETQPAAADTQPAAAAATEPAPAAAPASTPAAPAAASASPPAGQGFDLQSVPVSTRTPPPFPYLAAPADLPEKDVYTERDVDFDRVYVLVGEELRPVEGRVMQRKFFMHQLKWSDMAAHRNYENALKAMGAVRVDKVHPYTDSFIERNGGDVSAMFKRMGIPHINRMEDPDKPGFEQWLLRTPTTNVWMSFTVDNGQVYLLTVEEKAMQQQVQA